MSSVRLTKNFGTPTVDEFITKVRSQMRKRGMTVAQLAKAARVTRPYIYNVLSGDTAPSMRHAEKIGRPLGIAIRTVVTENNS